MKKRKISEYQTHAIESNKGYVLLSPKNQIFVIFDYEIEEVEEEVKRFFGRSKKVTNFYLTKFEVMSYSPDLEGIGWHFGEPIFNYLAMLDIYTLRSNWLKIRKQLEGFGFKILQHEDSVQ